MWAVSAATAKTAPSPTAPTAARSPAATMWAASAAPTTAPSKTAITPAQSPAAMRAASAAPTTAPSPTATGWRAPLPPVSAAAAAKPPAKTKRNSPPARCASCSTVPPARATWPGSRPWARGATLSPCWTAPTAWSMPNISATARPSPATMPTTTTSPKPSTTLIRMASAPSATITSPPSKMGRAYTRSPTPGSCSGLPPWSTGTPPMPSSMRRIPPPRRC